ncbi:hypothetical protein SCAB_53661 [Streptomyces scabiei 87.22]|uniref:Uncharacterized protein n=3 Tax=Streptomyces scabiei TaxID=1930 RepID=C9YWL8_STRSW|nr:hypothetical protein [Streptomyces scabiei]MDX2574438.1 hypothetical protein [Streptomyces scabiei]MDX2653705.1 hypothetical protein [Streptomyces scabiei]MDX2721926.1 hypothetical protein [Streptomyces scabiei]MDX2865470.1 hypothetical protein [Streptomyces scabiei]MDX2884188.1 hypothetical protein [Streptomyces scabiei]
MTTPRPRPAGKSNTPTTDQPRPAEPAPPQTTVGEPTGAARKGVVTSLPRTNRLPARDMRPSSDPTPERPGIRIYAPPVYRHHWDGARWSKRHGATPNAAYACACGHTDTATGPTAVAALVDDYAAHKHFCTGKPTASQEGRTAA